MDENEREAFQLAVHRRRYKRSPCDSFTFLFYSKISTASVDPGYAVHIMHCFCFIGVWCAAELSSVRKHEKYTKVNTNIKYKYVHNLHFKYIYIQIYANLSAWSRVELVADA